VPLLRHALRAGFAVRFGILPSQSGTFSRREKGSCASAENHGSFFIKKRSTEFPWSFLNKKNDNLFRSNMRNE
jgi:hypothetical protein